MSSYTTMIPWGTVLALAIGSAAAQTTAPPATAAPPDTIGVTPAEAAEATRQAVPRSDTGTVVRTAPSPAERMDTTNGANGAASANGANGTGRSATGTLDTDPTTGAATGASGVAGDASTPAMRSPRIDRN